MYHLEERVVQLNYLKDKQQIQEFLKKQDLKLDEDVEYTVALLYKDEIIATGSLAGKILKCIAVDSRYKGWGLSNKIISRLMEEAYQRGNIHLFVYTKPSNYDVFYDMGFYKIEQIDREVVLLENDPDGIKKYVKSIQSFKREGKIISSIVMNCNPFTLGHQYLIEKAAAASHVLHVFVVWENKSIFPSEVRYELVREGTKHLPNVMLHKGSDYIISSATFPSYFMKDEGNVVKTHALLDLKIFGKYIAPALGIHQRFVGEEPYCPVTRTYNLIMKGVLPTYGIDVVEIPRLDVGGEAVSASKVREGIRQNDFETVKKMVPQSTYSFLTSGKADIFIQKIQQHKTRHS
jgi:[citrate (pro-3S)-lyase] ligase